MAFFPPENKIPDQLWVQAPDFRCLFAGLANRAEVCIIATLWLFSPWEGTGCGCSSAVEHDLAKVGVASSILVARSILLQALLREMVIHTRKESGQLCTKACLIIEI